MIKYENGEANQLIELTICHVYHVLSDSSGDAVPPLSSSLFHEFNFLYPLPFYLYS